MAILNSLREVLSTRGVPQKSEGQRLRKNFEEILSQPAVSEPEAKALAEQRADQSTEENGNRQNVFVTPAALATFSGASAGITAVWVTLSSVFSEFELLRKDFVPFILSLLLGLLLLYMDLSDPERKSSPTRREVVIKSAISFINSCFLTASILGIAYGGNVFSNQNGEEGTPPVEVGVEEAGEEPRP